MLIPINLFNCLNILLFYAGERYDISVKVPQIYLCSRSNKHLFAFNFTNLIANCEKNPAIMKIKAEISTVRD